MGTRFIVTKECEFNQKVKEAIIEAKEKFPKVTATLVTQARALIYLNPCETAPFVIEKIKKAASNSKTNPRFEVIDSKYIRQIYSEYLEKEKNSY